MAKQAYCSECGAYVMLDETGTCPGGHGRPCYRDVREVGPVRASEAPVPAAPPVLSVSAVSGGRATKYARPGLVWMAWAALAGAGVVGFTTQAVRSGGDSVFWPGLGVAAAWAGAAFFYWGTPYAVLDDSGLSLSEAPVGKPLTLAWSDVMTGRRVGARVRLETSAGKPVDVRLGSVHRGSREQLLTEFAQRLGLRWTPDVDGSRTPALDVLLENLSFVGLMLFAVLAAAAIIAGLLRAGLIGHPTTFP